MKKYLEIQNEILNILGAINLNNKIDSLLNSSIFLEAIFYNGNFPPNEFLPIVFAVNCRRNHVYLIISLFLFFPMVFAYTQVFKLRI